MTALISIELQALVRIDIIILIIIPLILIIILIILFITPIPVIKYILRETSWDACGANHCGDVNHHPLQFDHTPKFLCILLVCERDGTGFTFVYEDRVIMPDVEGLAFLSRVLVQPVDDSTSFLALPLPVNFVRGV